MPVCVRVSLCEDPNSCSRSDVTPPAPQSQDTLARRRHWEHPRDTLRLQSVLGEGHFGQVSLG